MFKILLTTANIHKSCPQLNVFNYDYQTWREKIDVATNLELGGLLINVCRYALKENLLV